MKYEIHGTTLQVLEVELEAGEAVFTESGGMSWMTDGVEMETGVRGGLMSGLKRKLSGESLFLTTYKATAPATINFASEFPGKILDFQLGAGESLICQKDSFMCAEDSVTLETHFQKKIGAGFFGGEGFVLQKVTGPGRVFLEIAGEVVERELGSGERLKVDPGHVALFQPTVEYNIERVKGVKNMLFGGEGLFLATVTGPGRIWLQSMPISSLAAVIRRFIPCRSG